MDTPISDLNNSHARIKKKASFKLNLRNLRLSLKYRPKLFRLLLKMKECIRKKNMQIRNLKKQATEMVQKPGLNVESQDKILKRNILKDSTTQTDNTIIENTRDLPTNSEQPSKIPKEIEAESAWNLKENQEGKSIADQVKEAAQSALQQTGMVYVESAGMYYDYKTGYYYNSELGLYYHSDTGCYYRYNDDKTEFIFHSYPVRTAAETNPTLEAHERRKARKERKEGPPTKAKRRKKEKKTKRSKKSRRSEAKSEDSEKLKDADEDLQSSPKEPKVDMKTDYLENEPKDSNEQCKESDNNEVTIEVGDTDNVEREKEDKENVNENNSIELEDGECSETESESEETSTDESIASTVSLVDDDAVAKHHPPCMRIIVKETKLPKLKVGSLFLVTKDGGTVGREGEHHTIVLKDHNVSRNHLDIKYDMQKKMYMATDLGSKNGTFLNGIQMSESQEISLPMEVIHGSTIHVGETKLLCHIHPGNDTCGHCEPGLIMETQEKEKVAYTRTCDVKKQYELELARLKNKYKPEPLMIEDGSYNDRAKARREAVGSTHHAEKTKTADVDTHIEPENKGFKLLQKMGWSQGEGLGKDNQGDTAPIPLVNNEGTAGLGAPGSVAPAKTVPVPKVRNTLGPATLRLATRSKMLQPPAKAFQAEEEEDDDE